LEFEIEEEDKRNKVPVICVIVKTWGAANEFADIRPAARWWNFFAIITTPTRIRLDLIMQALFSQNLGVKKVCLSHAGAIQYITGA
jgi:hypothetical protein